MKPRSAGWRWWIAWVKFQEVSEQTLAPSKQRDEIVFNILRLDPLHRHAFPSLDRVTDLAGLWNAVAAASSHLIPPATNLFELTASKLVQNKKSEKSGDEQDETVAYMDQMQIERDMVFTRRNMSPGGAVAQTSFVRLAGQMIFNNNNYNRMIDY